ncbi:hypothetical protein [Pantoea sp. SS70]|uniref:RipA family octameric membrane protein n=1 Tax=Pantoea sp. SS70 TaxID=3024247 RepID=UPI002452EEDC|nr:hypothetical protein [Pantoea sp. SS70]WGK58977.1 hypothetical protein PO881_09300 [Pantoea sp. SS70]
MEDFIKVREKDTEYLTLLLDKDIKTDAILASFKDGKLNESIDYLKIKEAYAKAHDIRKFEIELYWKRANYFWLFMTALSGLIGFSLNSENHYVQVLSPALSIVGFILGLAFFCANRGSKFWQENWEKNLDKLEYYISGDLYKITAKINILKPSVSKINSYIAKIICLLWIVIFIFTLSFIVSTLKSESDSFLLIITYTIFSIIVPAFVWSKIKDSKIESSNPEFYKR